MQLWMGTRDGGTRPAGMREVVCSKKRKRGGRRHALKIFQEDPLKQSRASPKNARQIHWYKTGTSGAQFQSLCTKQHPDERTQFISHKTSTELTNLVHSTKANATWKGTSPNTNPGHNS